jgi:hypothetical protein
LKFRRTRNIGVKSGYKMHSKLILILSSLCSKLGDVFSASEGFLDSEF